MSALNICLKSPFLQAPPKNHLCPIFAVLSSQLCDYWIVDALGIGSGQRTERHDPNVVFGAVIGDETLLHPRVNLDLIDYRLGRGQLS